MTEFNERIEGEIKSHEHEMLEKIKKEKAEKRKKLVLDLHKDWKDFIQDLYSKMEFPNLAKHCIRKSLIQQKSLLENLLKKENSKPAKEVIQREMDKVDELIKESELI